MKSDQILPAKMTWQTVVLTMLVVTSSVTQASVLHHQRRQTVDSNGIPVITDFEEDPYSWPAYPSNQGRQVVDAQYEPSENEPEGLFGKLMAVESAFDNVVSEELAGLDMNLKVFAEKLLAVLNDFNAKYRKALLPLIEACPAEAFKTGVIEIMNALVSLLEDIETVLEEYNPLHPQTSEKIRSMIRRKLTTISTLGGAIGNLFDAVDDLVVAAVEGIVENLKITAKSVRLTAAELEKVPADFLKQMAIQGLQGQLG